jgi:hypothetical protein
MLLKSGRPFFIALFAFASSTPSGSKPPSTYSTNSSLPLKFDTESSQLLATD